MPKYTYEAKAKFDALYQQFPPEGGEPIGYERSVCARWNQAGVQAMVYTYNWPRDARILIVGCGFGWSIEVLMDRYGYTNILGTDTSPWIQAEKAQINPTDGLSNSHYPNRIVPLDVLNPDDRIVLLTMGGPFDHVFTENMISAFHDAELPDLSAACHALLAPGGMVMHFDFQLLEGTPGNPLLNAKTVAEWKAFMPSDVVVGVNNGWEIL